MRLVGIPASDLGRLHFSFLNLGLFPVLPVSNFLLSLLLPELSMAGEALALRFAPVVFSSSRWMQTTHGT